MLEQNQSSILRRRKLVAGHVLWVFVVSQIAEIREGAAKVVPAQRGSGCKVLAGGHDDPSLVLRFIRD
jgi:hypothetical protein